MQIILCMLNYVFNWVLGYSTFFVNYLFKINNVILFVELMFWVILFNGKKTRGQPNILVVKKIIRNGLKC